MGALLPPIWFYIPGTAFHAPPPRSLRQYRQWALDAFVRKHFWGVGKFNWILQTYYHLAGAGFPCTMTTQLPAEGVVVTHRHFLPDGLRPGPRQLLVCVLADKEMPENVGRHPYAQIHLVQNPRDPMLSEADDGWHACFVPFWTQIDLVPRSPERGDRFENIGFFGIEGNMAPELKEPAFHERLRARGLRLRRMPRDQWHDYSDIDVVLGVRTFDDSPYHYKPATKLHNAWRAGVPAVMGTDSAYQAERRSPLDYLEVRTPGELEEALDRLAASPELRRQMADNGRARAVEVSDASIRQRWMDVLRREAVPRYRAWCALDEHEQARVLERRVQRP